MDEKEGQPGDISPWSGQLDGNELERKGGALLAAIMQCAYERGHQGSEIAAELGVTYGYINQLRNGLRKVQQISDEFAQACARYLGIPRMTVLMLAGRVTPEDFYEPDRQLALSISAAMKHLKEDVTWGPLVTEEVLGLDVRSQFLVLRLYEEATGMTLLPGRIDPEELVARITELRKVQQEWANRPDETGQN